MTRMAAIAMLWLTVLAAGWAAESATGGAWRTLGDKAPELNVDFVKGDPIALADGAGRHVFLIEFWATWCGPCRYSAPHLSEMQAKYGDRGLVVLGISDESRELVDPYVAQMGDKMAYRVAIDRARTTASRYFEGFGREETLPTSFVVDGNGRVAWIGHPNNPFLDTLLPALLDDLPRIRDERAKSGEQAAPKE